MTDRRSMLIDAGVEVWARLAPPHDCGSHTGSLQDLDGSSRPRVDGQQYVAKCVVSRVQLALDSRRHPEVRSAVALGHGRSWRRPLRGPRD